MAITDYKNESMLSKYGFLSSGAADFFHVTIYTYRGYIKPKAKYRGWRNWITADINLLIVKTVVDDRGC
jgi:hypothetical protein